MNNKGRGSGLALILFLVVALIVAWLAVQNMSSLGVGNTPAHQEQTKESDKEQTQDDPVKKAQDMVDQYNDKANDLVDELNEEP